MTQIWGHILFKGLWLQEVTLETPEDWPHYVYVVYYLWGGKALCNYSEKLLNPSRVTFGGKRMQNSPRSL